MDLLDPVLQSYPWGSRTHLADITGVASPTAKPWAELWFGAHPLASATVDGKALDSVIAADPVAALGARAASESEKLPFLLKLLAADEPLSLQAHPTLAEAQEGFHRENAQGIPPTAHFRNYRDDNHKPELIVALTQFDALAGFRPVERTKQMFEEFGVPELEHYLGLLDSVDDESSLRALFTTWLTLPQDVLDELVETTAKRCAEYGGDDSEYRLVAETTCELARKYPGDPGVLGSMLLNRLRLMPGEAIFLGAGQLHAYLGGMGVEIMANSDNVLRGGLTSKHVDVVELLRVLCFEPLEAPVLHGRVDGEGWSNFDTPANEFSLASTRVESGESVDFGRDSATIVLVTEGKVTLSSGSQTLDVPCGHAAWIPAAQASNIQLRAEPQENQSSVAAQEAADTARATGAQVFVATVPR